jgi:MFS family permease
LWESHPEWVFFVVAAGLVVGFGVVALGVRERRDLIHLHKTEAHISVTNSRSRSLGALAQYVGSLFHTQREAVKLLGVKFLYEFGISAALPFLTLFMVEEIGVTGWREMIAAAPPLVAFGLDRMDAQGLSQLVAAFLLLVTMLSVIPSGLLGDRIGKKKIFALGLLIVGVSALFAAFATSVPQLLFYLLFLGLGNGARIVLYSPYMADLIPVERVGNSPA